MSSLSEQLLALERQLLGGEGASGGSSPSLGNRGSRDDDIEHIRTPGMWLPDRGLCFEQIEGEEFLLSDGRVSAFIPNGGGSAFFPLPRDQVTWNVCTISKIVPVDKKKLWKFIRQFLYRSVELPDDLLYDVLTAWVFATWVPELWGTVPYVFFLGPKNSGKTRGLEALQMLCYRGKFSISSTPAALYRSIEKFNVVPFLDESEVYNQEQKADVVACLNAGYKRRSARIERCGGENMDTLVNFNVFGFKALAGTESLRGTLESRSIIIHMSRNTRQLDIILNEQAALEIRNKLLLWRFDTLVNSRIPPQTNMFGAASDEFDACADYDEFDAKTRAKIDIPADLREVKNSRIIELFAPLTAVADAEEKKAIVEYAKKVAMSQKGEEITSLEAELVLALLACKDSVVNGAIANDDIERAFNEGRPVKEQMYGKSLGIKIAALGFERCRVGRKRGFLWDANKLRRLCDRFGLDASDLNDSPLLRVVEKKKTFDDDKVASCTVTPVEQRKFNQICARCNEKRDMIWSVKMFDGSSVDVCNACGGEILDSIQRRSEING